MDKLDIADKEMIPICQDTGMAVIFLEIGQDVHLEGGVSGRGESMKGSDWGYTEGYLTKICGKRSDHSVKIPKIIRRRVHPLLKIVAGDKVEVTVAPKGFGSENMSRVFMLKPADGIEGVKRATLTAVSGRRYRMPVLRW